MIARREFLKTAAAVAVMPTAALANMDQPPKPRQVSSKRYANGYSCDEQSGLHIEGFNWIPNFHWTYLREPGDHSAIGTLQLQFMLPDKKGDQLSEDLWDWWHSSKNLSFAGGRMLTLWDFANNKQECLDDVCPVAIESTYSGDWEHLKLDLLYGDVIDYYYGHEVEDKLLFIHVPTGAEIGKLIKLNPSLLGAVANLSIQR